MEEEKIIEEVELEVQSVFNEDSIDVLCEDAEVENKEEVVEGVEDNENEN